MPSLTTPLISSGSQRRVDLVVGPPPTNYNIIGLMLMASTTRLCHLVRSFLVHSRECSLPTIGVLLRACVNGGTIWSFLPLVHCDNPWLPPQLMTLHPTSFTPKLPCSSSLFF